MIRFKTAWAAFVAALWIALGFVFSDGLIIAGGALVAAGAWMTFEPAGFIVGGAELVAFGWFVGGR